MNKFKAISICCFFILAWAFFMYIIVLNLQMETINDVVWRRIGACVLMSIFCVLAIYNCIKAYRSRTKLTWQTTQVGKWVTLTISLHNPTESALSFELPSDAPKPADIPGFNTVGDYVASGTGWMFDSFGYFAATRVGLIRSSVTAYEITMAKTEIVAKWCHATIQYWAV